MVNVIRIRHASILGIAALLTASSLHAATITDSPTAPAGAAISSADGTGALNGSQDYTDNGGPPGQTFTAPVGVPFLTGFTFQGGASSGNPALNSFNIQVGSVNTVTGAITNLDTESVSTTGTPGASDYLTFTLGTSVPLVAGTTYSVSVDTSANYYGFARSTTDVYAGGTAFNNDKNTTDGGNASPARTFNGFVSPRAYDYVFYVNPTPEPASLSLFGLGAVGLLARRRRTA